jgi:hypothetical protein
MNGKPCCADRGGSGGAKIIHNAKFLSSPGAAALALSIFYFSVLQLTILSPWR